jgi:hypothetical protein
VELCVQHSSLAQSLAGMNMPCLWNVWPSDARAKHTVASLVQEKGAEEVVAERFIMETVHETLADLRLVRCRNDISSETQQRRLAMRESAAPRRCTRAELGRRLAHDTISSYRE